MSKRVSKVTIDHDEIRRWAEKRKGKPALVRNTGIIRLDFPGFTGEDKLESIAWDDWFDRFDDSNLALVYEESTARGQQSNFNKLVGRETVDLRTGELRGPPRRRAKQGARTTQDARRIRDEQARAVRSRRASARPRKAATASTTARKTASTTTRGRKPAPTPAPSRARTRKAAPSPARTRKAASAPAQAGKEKETTRARKGAPAAPTRARRPAGTTSPRTAAPKPRRRPAQGSRARGTAKGRRASA